MSANVLLEVVNQAVYVLVFAATLLHAIRYPRRTNVDVALFFGDIALVVGLGILTQTFQVQSDVLTAFVVPSVGMALPFLLLRLVEDFSDIPSPVLGVAGALLAPIILSFALIPAPTPAWLVLAYVLYFATFVSIATFSIVREARRSVGLTHRRMQAIAAGSAFLGLDVLAVGAQALVPGLASEFALAGGLCGLASGLSYFVGFAPPPLLRRAWHAPALRAFLQKAPALVHQPDMRSFAEAFQSGAAAVMSAPHARVGIWDKSAGAIRFVNGDVTFDVPPGKFIAGQVFVSQRSLFTEDTTRADPANADFYRSGGINALLAVPISSGTEHLGVLVVYARRAPVFAEDDLALAELLANQAAVILQNRLLIDEIALVRAREEATRLKDDFLSAAAHDLKTPLTTLLAQAQLLERRATRNPATPPDLDGIHRIVRESQRMAKLIHELVDVTWIEKRGFVGTPEEVDLRILAREACERQTSDRHQCRVDAPSPVVGWFDLPQINQLLDSLIENAVKYSPGGGEVRVELTRDEDRAYLAVTDNGIGIPPDDVPHIFERFRRGANVDDRQFAGMGLGLYLCRQIVEQHGGRVWASSTWGQGTTIHAHLSLRAPTPGWSSSPGEHTASHLVSPSESKA